MVFLINIIWFIRTTKFVLFWLYLWQLKEYHLGRFVDHFRTYNGRKTLFSYIYILKIILLFFCLADNSLIVLLLPVLFFVYIGESALFVYGIYKKTAKRPKLTLKTGILLVLSFGLIALFLASTVNLLDQDQLILLLAFDVFLLFIISLIVLAIQPFFVLARKIILYRAKEKLKKIKLLSGLKVIAITGSYGKTSTKEFLKTILSKKYKVLSTQEHQNSEIGIANCILKNLQPSHQIFIAEIGAYNKGKIKEVCDVLNPKIGVVTGVNEQHLALFGSLENLLSAEGGQELADSLPKDGLLIVNGNNKYCLDLLKKSHNLPDSQEKIYSTSNKTTDSDIWTEDIEVSKNNISFVAMNKNKEMLNFNVNILGKHNVENLLGAILIANELKMSLEEISLACKDIKQDQAGIILKQGKYGINIIDSSYSSNPTGVFADIEYLSLFSGKKVIIMPCLIELGEKSSEIHKKIGEKIGETCDLAIITTKDRFKEIKTGAIKKGMAEKNILLCLPAGRQATNVYSAITTFCKSGDTILLEGRVPNSLIKLLSK